MLYLNLKKKKKKKNLSKDIISNGYISLLKQFVISLCVALEEII